MGNWIWTYLYDFDHFALDIAFDNFRLGVLALQQGESQVDGNFSIQLKESVDFVLEVDAA